MRLSTILVLILICAPLCRAQKFHFSPLSESVIRHRVEDAPSDRREREKRIKELFAEAGCGTGKLNEQPLQNMEGENVICRLAGTTNQTIVVGANYDSMEIDNWAGASLLPSLFQSLNRRKRSHTFVFVAFADNKGDLAGSQFFARQMAQSDLERTDAMIDLSALGFSPTKVSSAASDKKLVELFFRVIYALNQVASQVDISKAVHADSEPFAALHIPQITIHSLTHESVAAMLPQEQQPEAAAGPAHFDTHFQQNFYYKSYRLISGYLAYLDETLKPRQHDSP
jgi:Peptidase family M28